jgi:hypothetical protein
MAQDDDGFVVLLPTQQRAACQDIHATVKNANDSESDPNNTEVLLSGALNTATTRHAPARHQSIHAVAVFSFALEVLAIVSRESEHGRSGKLIKRFLRFPHVSCGQS